MAAFIVLCSADVTAATLRYQINRLDVTPALCINQLVVMDFFQDLSENVTRLQSHQVRLLDVKERLILDVKYSLCIYFFIFLNILEQLFPFYLIDPFEKFIIILSFLVMLVQ
jgi:hypothetical protein